MKRLLIVFIAVLFVPANVVYAELHDRGGGLIYDDVLNVTWLQNANYAATELSDSRANEIISNVGSIGSHVLIITDFQSYSGTYNGEMSWWGAMAWVDQLNYAGYDDWRLPSTDETVINPNGSFGYEGPDQNGEYDYRDGYNMVNSEMGYLYYETL